MVVEKLFKERRRADQKKKYDMSFPLPGDVQNLRKTLRGGQVNFQTDLTLREIVDFYRRGFTARGLVEIELLTLITDECISLVFTGLPRDKRAILQAIDLGYGSNIDRRNVNLRTEKSRGKIG